MKPPAVTTAIDVMRAPQPKNLRTRALTAKRLMPATSSPVISPTRAVLVWVRRRITTLKRTPMAAARPVMRRPSQSKTVSPAATAAY
jgi:hypothetical protein